MSQNSTNDTVMPDYVLPLQICWFIFGFFSFLANLFVMLTIAKTKDLHNKSQYAIFSHAFVEFAFGLFTCMFGLRGCIFYALQLPAVTQYECFLMGMPQIIVGSLSLVATMELGFDRLLASKFPIFYKQLNTRRYLILFNLGVWGYALLQLIQGFFLLNPNSNQTVAICSYATALTPLHFMVANSEGTVVAVCTIAVYVTALVTVGYRYWGTKWLNEAQKSAWARKVQLSAFKTIMILGAIYFFCWAMTILFTVIANFVPPNVASMLVTYGSLLLNVNGITHLFVYASLNPKFRNGLRNLVFGMDAALVVSVNTTKIMSKSFTSRVEVRSII